MYAFKIWLQQTQVSTITSVWVSEKVITAQLNSSFFQIHQPGAFEVPSLSQRQFDTKTIWLVLLVLMFLLLLACYCTAASTASSAVIQASRVLSGHKCSTYSLDLLFGFCCMHKELWASWTYNDRSTHNVSLLHSPCCREVIDWLTDWLTGWLIDWLNDWLVDWLMFFIRVV